MPLFTIEPRQLWSRDPPPEELEERARVIVGAPLGVDLGEDWPAVRLYAARLGDAFASLDADARAQIVYQDPAALADTAADWGTGTPASVAVLEDRAAKRGPQQTAKDLAWAGRFGPLYTSFLQWRYDIDSISPGRSTSTAWAEAQNFEARLRQLAGDFTAQLGGKITNPLPKSLETPTGEPPPKSPGIDWDAVKTVGYVLGGAFALGAVAKIIRG